MQLRDHGFDFIELAVWRVLRLLASIADEFALVVRRSNLPSSYLGPRRWHFYLITSSARASSIGGLGAFIMIAKNVNSFGNALIKS